MTRLVFLTVAALLVMSLATSAPPQQRVIKSVTGGPKEFTKPLIGRRWQVT
jgi:hypothetical protein